MHEYASFTHTPSWCMSEGCQLAVPCSYYPFIPFRNQCQTVPVSMLTARIQVGDKHRFVQPQAHNIH